MGIRLSLIMLSFFASTMVYSPVLRADDSFRTLSPYLKQIVKIAVNKCIVSDSIKTYGSLNPNCSNSLNSDYYITIDSEEDAYIKSGAIVHKKAETNKNVVIKFKIIMDSGLDADTSAVIFYDTKDHRLATYEMDSYGLGNYLSLLKFMKY